MPTTRSNEPFLYVGAEPSEQVNSFSEACTLFRAMKPGETKFLKAFDFTNRSFFVAVKTRALLSLETQRQLEVSETRKMEGARWDRRGIWKGVRKDEGE